MSSNQDMPKWDVALAALAGDEFRKKASPLTLNGFRDLAKKHAIRLDDIMETMFLLAINREWAYTDRPGKEQPLDQNTLMLSTTSAACVRKSWVPLMEYGNPPATTNPTLPKDTRCSLQHRLPTAGYRYPAVVLSS